MHQALVVLDQETHLAGVQEMSDFIRSSKRGICAFQTRRCEQHEVDAVDAS